MATWPLLVCAGMALGACAAQNMESTLTRAGGYPLTGEQLEEMLSQPVTLGWKSWDGLTTGVSEATPDGFIRDYDILGNIHPGAVGSLRNQRHNMATRTLKYVLVNNAFCVAQVAGQPYWCVRFFQTGHGEYTALFANGEMYKRFTVERGGTPFSPP